MRENPQAPNRGIGHHGSLTRSLAMPDTVKRKDLKQLRCFARAPSNTKRGVRRRVCVHRLTIRPAFVRKILPNGAAFSNPS
jgi:hypothetical protein